MSSSGGPGFLGLLCLVFITLKLTGFISWSWWWILSPFLIPLGFALLVLVVWFLLWLFGNLWGFV